MNFNKIKSDSKRLSLMSIIIHYFCVYVLTILLNQTCLNRKSIVKYIFFFQYFSSKLIFFICFVATSYRQIGRLSTAGYILMIRNVTCNCLQSTWPHCVTQHHLSSQSPEKVIILELRGDKLVMGWSDILAKKSLIPPVKSLPVSPVRATPADPLDRRH